VVRRSRRSNNTSFAELELPFLIHTLSFQIQNVKVPEHMFGLDKRLGIRRRVCVSRCSSKNISEVPKISLPPEEAPKACPSRRLQQAAARCEEGCASAVTRSATSKVSRRVFSTRILDASFKMKMRTTRQL
jgi:hypothetical protein